MNRLTVIGLILGGILMVPAFAETAADVLARMDKEAATFSQVAAKLKRTEYTAVLNDTTLETGQIYLRRKGREMIMRGEMTAPDPRSVALESGKAQIYYPKINTVQIYDLGKTPGLSDALLTLGFGSSGRDLSKNYTITYGGEETVAGQKVSRIELVPKSAKVRNDLKIEKIEMWVPLNAGHPIQQKILQPGGNFYLFSYSDIRVNPNLPESEFRLNLPKGVKTEYPGK